MRAREKSASRFKDQVRRLTRRKALMSTHDLIQQFNPIVRGWGHYYKRSTSEGSFTGSTSGWCDVSGRRLAKWRCCG
jgi:hypothetical protein